MKLDDNRKSTGKFGAGVGGGGVAVCLRYLTEYGKHTESHKNLNSAVRTEISGTQAKF
jgi:hypothetical protein